jgi:bifunctional ADP-heptose synthase (sugar kinase/adenylyltransferase)
MPTAAALVDTNCLERAIASFPKVRAAVLGDFCLDAYWMLDTEKIELSVETYST